MLEWLKRHAWKACIRQKRIPSSNLGHSAKKKDDITVAFLFLYVIQCYKPDGVVLIVLIVFLLIVCVENHVDEINHVGDGDEAIVVHVGISDIDAGGVIVEQIINSADGITDVY